MPMIKPKITVFPAVLPVSSAEIKRQATAVDFADDDTLLDEYVKSATDHLDGYSGILGAAIMDQTIEQGYTAFCREMRLPYGPATIIDSVEYYDDADVNTPFAGGHALFHDDCGSFVWYPKGTSFPAVADRPDAIRVTYRAGATDPAAVDGRIKQAIRLAAVTWYENRGFDTDPRAMDFPEAAYSLIAPLRKSVIV